MLYIMRRESTFIGPYLLIFMLMPILFHIIPFMKIPVSTYIVFLYLLLGAPFYFERVTQMDRYMISLPINKRKLVLTRYISLTLAILIGAGFVLAFGAWTNHPAAENYIVILVIFTSILTCIAVSLPLIYFFEKLWAAYLALFLLTVASVGGFLIISFSSILDWLVEPVLKIIDWNPTLVLLLFSFVLLSLSYRLSCSIYAKKDH